MMSSSSTVNVVTIGEPTPQTPTQTAVENNTSAAPAVNENDEQKDLTYDEYDLSKECDMVVTCKACDTEFKSLEKFILHKKSQCQSRQTDGGAGAKSPAKSPVKASSNPVIKKIAPKATKKVMRKLGDSSKSSDSPWIFESMSFDEPDEMTRVDRKRKATEPGELLIEEPETLTKRMNRVYSRRKPKTSPTVVTVDAAMAETFDKSYDNIDTSDRVRATTIPDEVQRLSSAFFGSKSQTNYNSDEEDDLENLVSVSVSPSLDSDSDESDPDLPVEVQPNPHANVSPLSLPKKVVKTTPVPLLPKKELTAYRLVGVEEQEKKVTSQPSLGINLSDLKNVKILNLMAPLPSLMLPGGYSIYENMNDGSLLDTEQTVLATTKDDVAVRLRLRRVVKEAPVSKLIATSVSVMQGEKEISGEKDQTPAADAAEKDGGKAAGDKGDNSSGTTEKDLSSGLEADVEETENETDVCTSTVFEHDPDLYAFLKDDEEYTLMPRQRTRLSRFEIKNRKDCDWLTRRCFRCNTLYSCVKTLINHMNYQHADKKAFFPCIYCRTIYSQQKNLSRHLQKTHNKSKNFTDRLRGFVRNQAFVRQIKNLDVNSEKLTEENDPFLRNLRTRMPPNTPTKFCSISDAEMLARYGRKVEMVGRPPGRPSKVKPSHVLLTCIMCSASISTYKEMLRHLKATHGYSQRKLNKLKPKLVDKINDVAIRERERAVEKIRKPVSKLPVNKNSDLASKVDEYGRLVTDQNKSQSAQPLGGKKVISQPVSTSASLRTHTTSPVKSIVAKPPQKIVPTPTIAPKIEQLLQLVQCQGCSKVFNGHAALSKHSCSPTTPTIVTNPQIVHHPMVATSSQSIVTTEPLTDTSLLTEQVATTSQDMTSSVSGQLIHQSEESVAKLIDSVAMVGDNSSQSTLVVDQSGAAIKFINAPELNDVSGLETLAMISTNEAQRVESPKETDEIVLSTEGIVGEQADGDTLHTLSITLEQLEQLKAGGNNIIYVVKTSTGDVERIDDPQGMEVVEISQLTDQSHSFLGLG